MDSNEDAITVKISDVESKVNRVEVARSWIEFRLLSHMTISLDPQNFFPDASPQTRLTVSINCETKVWTYKFFPLQHLSWMSVEAIKSVAK